MTYLAERLPCSYLLLGGLNWLYYGAPYKAFTNSQGTPLEPMVQVIAHRTAWRDAPENSLPGVELCIAHGFEWAEIDVRRTADGHHVLLHDPTLDRITRSHGRVDECSLAEIRELALSCGSDSRGDPARYVPTLREALDLARGRIGLYLDCRGVVPAELVSEVADAEMISDVMVSIEPHLQAAIWSASGGSRVRLVRQLAADAECLGAAADGPLELEVPYGQISAPLMARATRESASVTCVTLGAADQPAAWRWVIGLKVRRIMTDYPADLRKEIQSCADRV